MKIQHQTAVTALKKNNHERLVHAIWGGDEISFLDYLAQAPETGFKDRFGRTILFEAVIRSKIGLIEPIIRAGGDVNVMDENGMSPLHHAAERGLDGIASVLLSNGANVNAVDKFGNIPLFRAVFHSPKNEKLIQILLVHGSNPDSVNVAGVSPRSLARTLQLDLFR